MKKIPLNRGKYALVDNDDFEYLNKWNWYLSDGGYAIRHRLKKEPGKGSFVRMHRVVNNTPDGIFTDHINRDKLDNRKENLRNADKSLNSLNRDKRSDNKSGYKGVYFDTWSGKWRAELKIMNNKYRLGRYDNLKDAINARLEGEKLYA